MSIFLRKEGGYWVLSQTGEVCACIFYEADKKISLGKFNVKNILKA